MRWGTRACDAASLSPWPWLGRAGSAPLGHYPSGLGPVDVLLLSGEGSKETQSLTVFEESVLIFHLELSGYFCRETQTTFSFMSMVRTLLGVGSESTKAYRDALA